MANHNKSKQAKSSARMAGVQFLYEAEINDGLINPTTGGDFSQQYWGHKSDDRPRPDKVALQSLIAGVSEDKVVLDEIIISAIDNNRSFGHIDVLLKSILRAATYELLRQPDVPMPVVIDEYVEVARAFYFENEPAFVNGVLDNIGKVLRHPSNKIIQT